MQISFLLLLFGTATALRCYEGTVDLNSNLRTPTKDCPVSSYCVQKIDKNSQKIVRECASWSDEHSMEEKCPMSGCHWQTKAETFCCCQFDLCNEYKADGSQFNDKEMVLPGTATNSSEKTGLYPTVRAPKDVKTMGERMRAANKNDRRTSPSSADNGEIDLV